MNILRVLRPPCGLLAILVVFAAACQQAPAQSLPQAQLRLAQNMIAGHKTNIEKIVAGSFTATGRSEMHIPESNVDSVGPASLVCIFDDATNRFRFSRREPEFEKALLETGQNFRGGTRIVTPEKTIHARNDATLIDILPTDTRPLPAIEPFDIRLAGLVSLTEMFSPKNYTIDSVLGSEGFLKDALITNVEPVSPGIVAITWIYGPNGDFKRIIHFDESHGYGPIRMESFAHKYSVDSKRLDEWADASAVCDVSWIEYRDVWVPSSFSISRSYGHLLPPYQPSEKRSYSYSVEWLSVNEALEEELFAVDAIKTLPKGHVVVDHRLGEPLIVEHPGLSSETLAMVQGSQGKRPDALTSSFTLTQKILIAANVFGVILFVLARL